MMIVENEVVEERLDVEQLAELKALSEQLYQFATELGNKAQKIEALVDLQEEYEDKHQRLFFRVVPPHSYTSKPVGQPVDHGRVELKDKPTRVQFEQDSKKNVKQVYDYDKPKETHKLPEYSRR